MSANLQVQNLPIIEVWFDYSRNLRISYKDCEPSDKWNPSAEFDPTDLKKSGPTPKFYNDIYTNGILTPLEVSKLEGKELVDVRKRAMASGLSKAEADLIKYRGIRGHRRFYVVNKIRSVEPDRFKTIPCLVRTGLTYQEEMNLLIDQFGVKTLNSCEIVNAIRELTNQGMTQVQIAERIQMSKGFVQRRQWVLSFPSFVLDAWKHYYTIGKASKDVDPKTGKAYTRVNLTDTVLVELNKAANIDRNAKPKRALDHPDSEFMKVWNSLVNPSTNPDGSVASVQNAPKAMSKSDIDKIMTMNGDLDPILVSAFQYVTKTADINLTSLDSECKLLRVKAARFDEMNKKETADTSVKPRRKKA